MADVDLGSDHNHRPRQNTNNNDGEQPSSHPRPLSTASSQLSFSDHQMEDGGVEADEDNSSLLHHSQFGAGNPGSSTCSSSYNLHRQSSSGSQQDGQHLHPNPNPPHGASSNPLAGSSIAKLVNGTGGGGPAHGVGMSHSLAKTTTISTIAMESNTSATSKCSPTRLVIALLQTPHQALHLKIIELSPNLLKLPDNLPEAEDYLKNHSQVIKNLQSKQSPVEELLRQADSLIATQKPRAEVYAAMADSLGQTWKDLNAILDERRIVIQLAYNCHNVIQSCVDRMNELHTAYSKFNYVPTIEEQCVQGGTPQDVAASLRKLKEDRADVLKCVSQALDVCQQLLNKITDFNCSIDSRQLFLKRDVDFATKQVHRWLERLHDRRMILEERLKMKREQFEEMADFLLHDKEISGLLQELERLRLASQEFSLGQSVQSAESQRDELERMVREMKMLQERALLTARKLEQDGQSAATKGRFYQRSGLKQKIYDILGTVNDLITESIDFELSLVDAKEFFHLADLANAKLDELASSSSSSAPESARVLPKSQINLLTFDALSKGQILLDSLGWDSPRTRGVRAVYEELNKRKTVIQDEIEHLELLDEYNQFLEKVNQAYQNILNVETSTVRQPRTLPVDLHLVSKFREEHERTMEELTHKTNFKELLSKLEQIYPGLSEEEKMSTERKVDQLKSLSNLLVELIHQRIWLAGEWHKILELDRNEWSILGVPVGSSSGKEISKRIHDVGENIARLYSPIREQLNEVHRSDPDLITTKMETKMEELVKKYRGREQELAAVHRIREICQAYKVRLDHHLLGNLDTISQDGLSSVDTTAVTAEPCYFPVLNEVLVAATVRSGEKPSKALERIVREQLREKLSGTLQNFFQPLLTNFRQEILEAQESLVGSQLAEKTTEEISWERYFERLKQSYVNVTKELESYLFQLGQICEEVEGRLEGGGGIDPSVDGIERELNELNQFRGELKRRMDQEVKQGLDKILSIVGHEEPPIQAEQEEHTVRTLTSTVLGEQLDSSISQKQDTLTRQLTEKMIHNDLDMINRTLNELISELEHPCNYGNNLRDAQTYLASFERFEKTVETLRNKLSRLLTTAGMSETDVKAQNLLGKLNLLVDRKGKRRELILLSLDYFKLIEESYEHYDKVNSEINDIITKSKSPNIQIEDIEGLLKQLETLKGKEGEQERRLDEIERISRIIFDVSQEDETRQHYPLRDRSAKMSGEISRVESDLTSLLNIIRKSQSEPVVKVTTEVPSAIELELESQILVERPPMKTKMERTTAAPPPPKKEEEVEVMEELIVPTRVIRPKSQEMCTQTSMLMDEDELEAKTREYLKEKERMTVAVLEVLRQSMSPLPPLPQTVEKETQFEEMEEQQRKTEKVDRDTLTQTVEERRRSFPTQTEEILVRKGVEISTETEEGEIFLEEAAALIHQHQQRPPSRECSNPMFIQPLKDLVVNEGDKVVLECKTTGRIHKLVWLKDGLEIQNNPDYKTDFLDGSTARLTIDEVLPEDSAIFTCRAYGEGENVMVETSGRLTIREPVTSLLIPPQFLPHLPTSTGEHGRPHVIQVKVEGNPLPTVQWFKNGQCIDTSPDYIITFNNGLCEVQFDELVKDMDDGRYICVATNKLGDCETTVDLEIKGDVDVSRKLSRLPPRIIQALPKNLMSRAGQKVKLECEFESHTDFTVVWIKDDSKILTKTNSSAEIVTQGDTSTLTFNEAYPVNSGKYTVLIRNAGGECQSDCQIIVKGLLPAETSDSELNISDSEVIKPSIKMPLKDVRGRVGETLRLDCVIVGSPEPEVIWYKNAVPLKESPNHQLLFTGDKCSLVINCADLSDNGIYSVSALNNCGEAGSKCQVFVFEKSPEVLESKPVRGPAFTKMIQDEMVNAGSDFSFVVELAPDPENPDVVTDVTWWKNNGQLLPQENRIQITKDGLQHRLHFTEVDLHDKGNYMVKAVNSGGDAKCFGCLIVKENFERVQPDEQVPVKEPVSPPVQPPKQTVTPPPTAPPQQKVIVTRTITKPPRFVIPLEGKMVDEGDKNVSLKCKIAASPPAVIKWTKNNSSEPLEPSPDSNMTLFYNEKNGDVELSLSVVNVKDGGRYTCHASNEHGLASTVSDLVVKKTTFPPVFSKRLQSLTMEEGKRIYMEVDVYGKPSPQIQWELNGQPITRNEEEGISIKSDSPTRHSLIVASGKREKHAGEYKVIARNEAGEATCSCTVNIIGMAEASSAAQAVFVPPPSKIVQIAAPPPKPVEATVLMENQLSSSLARKDEQSSSLVESNVTTTTIYTSSEEHKYESRVTQVISPVPAPDIDSLAVIRYPQATTSALAPTLKPDKPKDVVTSLSELIDDRLIPGPEPEILVAPPLSSQWARSKNQVVEKVKKLEEETAEAASSPQVEGPPGGVRIIPIRKCDSTPSPVPMTTTISASPIFPKQAEPIDFGEPPKIEPILPPTVSPSPYEGYVMREAPKMTHDATSSVSKDSYHVGDTFVQKEERHEEQRSSSQVSYIRPSKFVPERMRESDHESEVESTVIPSKWAPPPVTQPSATIPVSTPSAFVTITPTIPATFFSSPGSQQQTAPRQQQPQPAEPGGVKSLAKIWPPQSPTMETTQTVSSSSSTFETMKTQTLTTTHPSGGPSTGMSRLSPIGFPSERSARSPTPNREALEMDKLWSKPIRFASPVTVSQTSIPTQPSTVLTPTSTMKKQKPEVPPKPTSSWLKRTTPTPYSPVTSPLPSQSPLPPSKPEVPPKPSYLKSASPYSPLPSPLPTSRPVSATPGLDPGSKEALYYVSTVSTPRTTPVPPQILAGWTSPLPSTPEVPPEQSYSSSFHEKRDFFESTTSQSYHSSTMEEMSSSSHKQFSKGASSSTSPRPHGITSPTFMDFHPSGMSLIDQSFLPPPGEPPVFMYAPPPAKPTGSPSFSTVSSSSSKSSTFMQSPSKGIIATTNIPSSLPSSGKRQVSLSKEENMKMMMTMMTSTSKIEPPRQPPPQKVFTKPIVIISSGDDDVEKVRSSSSYSEVITSSLLKSTREEESTTTVSGDLASTAVVPFRRKHDVPYIRPTKFVPVLDYSSSSLEESGERETQRQWTSGEGQQDTSKDTWRKVTYKVPARRRDSLTSLVDKSMQEMNKQFKANIGQFSQGLCYNRTDRTIQSDLSGVGGGRNDGGTEVKPTKEKGVGEGPSGSVEDTNPLIYFKYDFGYEFGIANPRNVRASSEPLTKLQQALPSSSRPTSWRDPTGDGDDAPIVLPIIHETTASKGDGGKDEK